MLIVQATANIIKNMVSGAGSGDGLAVTTRLASEKLLQLARKAKRPISRTLYIGTKA